MEDAPTVLKVPMSEFPDVWIRLPNTNGQSHGCKTQSFLERNLHGHPQDCYGKGNSKKFYWNTVGKKSKLGRNVCL